MTGTMLGRLVWHWDRKTDEIRPEPYGLIHPLLSAWEEGDGKGNRLLYADRFGHVTVETILCTSFVEEAGNPGLCFQTEIRNWFHRTYSGSFLQLSTTPGHARWKHETLVGMVSGDRFVNGDWPEHPYESIVRSIEDALARLGEPGFVRKQRE